MKKILPLKLKPGVWLDHLVWLSWSICYALAFPTYNQSYMIWFAFVPVLVFAYIRPISRTVMLSLVYSVPFFLLVLYWLYGFWEPSLFLIIPIFAFYYAFFFFCIALIGKKMKMLRWLIVPMLWIANEYLRSVGFHGFPYNMIGETQWENLFFIQSADIFGVWGIGFIILLVNSVLAEIVVYCIGKKRISLNRELAVKASIVALVIVINFSYGIFQFRKYSKISENSPKEKLALIQPNFPSRDSTWWKNRWQNYGIIWKLNAEAAVQNPDMIVWSETMVKNYVWYYLENYRPDEEVNLFNIRFVKMPAEFGYPILLTSPNQIGGKNYNSADYLDPLTNIRQDNSKIHLAPFGEWMPVYDSVPIIKDLMEIEGAGAYVPSKDFNVIQGRKSRFRVLICYEDIFAGLARKFINKNVNYFINVSNDGWAYKLGFTHPMWQHLVSSVMTAVSVRRPIAKATNVGVTGIIDLTGKFKGDLGDYQRGVYVGEVTIADEKIESVYVRVGYLFPFIITILALIAFGFAVFCKSKDNLFCAQDTKGGVHGK